MRWVFWLSVYLVCLDRLRVDLTTALGSGGWRGRLHGRLAHPAALSLGRSGSSSSRTWRMPCRSSSSCGWARSGWRPLLIRFAGCRWRLTAPPRRLSTKGWPTVSVPRNVRNLFSDTPGLYIPATGGQRDKP